jgi:hypothetical protein
MNTIDPKIKRLQLQILMYQKTIQDLEVKMRREQRKNADLIRTINKMKREQT